MHLSVHSCPSVYVVVNRRVKEYTDSNVNKQTKAREINVDLDVKGDHP